ncbi:MAG TPA: SDR family oxidoreductase [Burkholderiaceae bacterium]|nr:SDR family oxidoreductase [Burkholderiaceae bacterium]
MEQKLAGKAAIVTGAARGIGRGIALHLARLGADVLVADKNFAAATEFGEVLGADSVDLEIEALGRRSARHEGDLSLREQAETMVEACRRAFGRVDILVNNAGGMVVPMERSSPSQVPLDDVARLFDLNYLTMMNCCQAVAAPMRSSGSGAIVNISSSAARFIMPGGKSATYGAIKAAVTHYTRSLALELAPSGIRVNAIAPSMVSTARILAQADARGIGTARDAASAPLGRLANAEDIAFVVEFLVTELSRYVVGQCISVCGGRHVTPC